MSPVSLPQARRPGMTMIEVLVTLGVILILISLVLPAVQSAQEASRRLSCQAHLQQLGVALQQHHEVYGRFPYVSNGVRETFGPGPHNMEGIPNAGQHRSAFVSLLPYLDQDTLHRQFNLEVPVLGDPNDVNDILFPHPSNLTAANTRLTVLLCPSDSAPMFEAAPGVNYRISLGPMAFIMLSLGPDPTQMFGQGAFQYNRFIRARDFSDGLSSTVMVSEKNRGRDQESFDPSFGYLMTNEHFSSTETMTAACASARPDASIPNYINLTGTYWSQPQPRYTAYTHDSVPNSQIPDCTGDSGVPTTGTRGMFSARSHHPGGVNLLFADGHVVFCGDSIDIRLWRALGTRNGNEQIERTAGL